MFVNFSETKSSIWTTCASAVMLTQLADHSTSELHVVSSTRLFEVNILIASIVTELMHVLWSYVKRWISFLWWLHFLTYIIWCISWFDILLSDLIDSNLTIWHVFLFCCFNVHSISVLMRFLAPFQEWSHTRLSVVKPHWNVCVCLTVSHQHTKRNVVSVYQLPLEFCACDQIANTARLAVCHMKSAGNTKTLSRIWNVNVRLSWLCISNKWRSTISWHNKHAKTSKKLLLHTPPSSDHWDTNKPV